MKQKMILKLKVLLSYIFFVIRSLHLNPTLGTSDELCDSGAIIDIKWCYMSSHKSHIGQTKWPSQCTSESTHPQSPINLELKECTHTSSGLMSIPRSKFLFKRYSLGFRGNTVDIKPKATPLNHEETKITLPNNQTYEFHSLHFHWGSRNDFGSEHTVDLESYPMEIHLSFFKRKYKDMSLAHEMDKDNSAVLSVAVFVDVTKNASAVTTNFLAQFTESFNAVKRIYVYTPIMKPLNLTSLFQSQMGYSYIGSYTGPNCRTCRWLILSHPLVVHESHLVPFRKIKFAAEKNNFRFV